MGAPSAFSANIRYHAQVRELFFDSKELSLSSKICLNRFNVFYDCCLGEFCLFCFAFVCSSLLCQHLNVKILCYSLAIRCG